MLVGQTISGGSLSVTVTVNLHVAVLPAASVTRNTLVVTSTGKAEPLANPPVCVVSAPAQLCAHARGAWVTTALHRLASTLATMLVGQTIDGGALSVTVTAKLHVAVLPGASVTRNAPVA